MTVVGSYLSSSSFFFFVTPSEETQASWRPSFEGNLLQADVHLCHIPSVIMFCLHDVVCGQDTDPETGLLYVSVACC